ncbi:PD-(D/E)XK motif protein [Mesorhizobium sp. AR02]|uniref:PD-(D/E)XK motif protein n=1 Tax=Mesorhizobium sp. AR02 TaxID=2865837 RepID=UPI0021604EE5|nr:PD-(D/E)XK motif protein [Mesorhizobium sp. AR02]UVK55378.1 PD-(D/E)XK motif protein [Mesorhizobium sp. AR02]
MTASPTDLDALWSRLAASGAGQRRFVSLRVDGAGALDVHAAIRCVDRSPCLLFDLPNPASVGDVEFEVGGMRCARGATDDGQSIVLSLEDGARRDLFATLAADLIAHAADVPAKASLGSVMVRLDAWRLFLRSVAGGLGRNEIVGLIGELRVLRELVEADCNLLSTWQAPDDGIHDFENRGHALEVKATLGAGSRVIISRLDQLDDAGLEMLHLVHLRLYETPQGESIDDIAMAIADQLPDDQMRRLLENALLRRGLSPDDRRARTGLRTALQQTAAYRIFGSFPRIVRADVPSAIPEVSYAVELAGAAEAVLTWPDVRSSFTDRAS